MTTAWLACLQSFFNFSVENNLTAKLDWLKPSLAWQEGTTAIVSSEAKRRSGASVLQETNITERDIPLTART